MRGQAKSQPQFLALFSTEQAVPEGHPIRVIKKLVDGVLKELSPLFDSMYAGEGRPSIPPERLLKAKLLIALHTVRSERQFCEQLRYNLLFRWFLDMDMSEEVFDASTFSQNQERLIQHDAARVFFDQIFELSRQHGWASDDHFTVDGTLIEACASLKRFARKEKEPSKTDDDPGNPSVDFKGEKRSNQTHQSTTDPEARLFKKAKGQAARLCFAAHALMENRHGLLRQLKVTSSTETTETEAAQEMLRVEEEINGVRPKTVGADKGYHNREFVLGLCGAGIEPHVAQKKTGERIDPVVSASEGYKVSQRIRKRVEEIFGWAKTVGGFRRTRYLGIERTQLCAHFVGAAYNLVRMANLLMRESTASPPEQLALV
jgi:transposase